MEFAARQFARRVLLVHFALLCVVLVAVGLAAKHLYNGARQQVIQQAKQTQKLLARQTAAGIEGYYESITDVLNLLQPADAEQPPLNTNRRQAPGARLDAPQQQTRRRTLESGPLSGMLARFTTPLWQIVKDKCSVMFLVDPVDGMSIVKVIGSSDDSTSPEEVVKQASAWLTQVAESRRKAVSAFYPNISGGAHLVCVPMRGPTALLMVAVVSVSSVDRDLLAALNRSGRTGSILLDESGTFILSSFPGVRGKKAADITDVPLRAWTLAQIQSGTGDTQTFDLSPPAGETEVKPSMTTMEPMEVLHDKKWFLIVASSLDEVDDFIRPIFRDAIVWASVVAMAVLALLVSTASQMIRSRLKLERAQMEILNKELTQARQIQLNWLPSQPCKLKGLNIAAMNTPASHVSGDFYNWFELPDGKICVTIGDVTGHGMSAAFLMATTQLLVRTNMPRFCDPGYCLEEVNRQLCTQVFSGQFVTMLILVIDLKNNQIDIASSGHPGPVLCDGGRARSIEIETQLVLGVDATIEYPTQKLTFAPGTGLLFYTDGVPDVQAPSGKRFLLDGLYNCLSRPVESAEQMLQTVTRSINQFRTGRDLSDDLTLLAIHFQPSEVAAISR